MTVTIQQLNDKTLLVKPEFHIISGRKKLRVEDLNLPAGVVLPPEQVASLGSKKFIDPDLISRFERLRDQFKRACLRVGVKFLGGFAIPIDKVDELMNELDEIVAEFYNVKTDFVNKYDDHIESWCKANPDWEAVVRRAVTPKSVVAAALSADYVMYNVQVPSGASSERLEQKVSDLGSRVYEEIAQEAQKFVDESMSIKNANKSLRYRTDAEGVTQKALRPIRRMRDKMAGLAFLDSGLRPSVDYINSVLEQMPEKGYIRNQEFNSLLMLAISMTDPSKIKQMGAAMAATDDSSDAFFGDEEDFDAAVWATTGDSAVSTDAGQVAVDDSAEAMTDAVETTVEESEPQQSSTVESQGDVVTEELDGEVIEGEVIETEDEVVTATATDDDVIDAEFEDAELPSELVASEDESDLGDGSDLDELMTHEIDFTSDVDNSMFTSEPVSVGSDFF